MKTIDAKSIEVSGARNFKVYSPNSKRRNRSDKPIVMNNDQVINPEETIIDR